jgi:mono/diheme cytochrome c family protein
MRLLRLVSLAAISTLTIGARAHAQDLPEGQGKALVQTACSQCHGVDVIVGQPRSREEWGEVVSRMVGNGAQLSDDDYNLVIEYLATHLGPASQNAPAKGHSTSTAPGGKHDE